MSAGIVTGLPAEARLAAALVEDPAMLAAGGGTPGGAARAAAELLARGATCLISFGLAGGLDPALRPGALVVPRAVVAPDGDLATDAGWTARLGGATHDRLATADAVVVTVTAKRTLRAATGAVAVDLESGAVAAAARAAGVAFAVLRAVCDPADRELPPAALLALDAGGAIGIGRVLGSLAARPDQLPLLLRLARDAARARAALIRRVGDIRRSGGLVG